MVANAPGGATFAEAAYTVRNGLSAGGPGKLTQDQVAAGASDTPGQSTRTER